MSRPTLHALRDAPRSALAALALVLASLAPPASPLPARDGAPAIELVSPHTPVGRVEAGAGRLFAGELSMRVGLDRPPIAPVAAWLAPGAPLAPHAHVVAARAPEPPAHLAATLARARRARLSRHRRAHDDEDDDA